MSEFSKYFTRLQIQKLEGSGFVSLYDLVTYFPFRIQKIVPFGNQENVSEDVFLWTATLKNISHRKNKRQFLVLDFSDGQRTVQLYLFSVAKFTLKVLEVGKTFQLLLKKKDSFWNLLRYSEYKPESLLDYFVLGRAKKQIYWQPVYKKINKLKSSDINNLHNRLPASVYRINLEGLVPINNLIPSIIDLSEIHKPSSKESSQKAIKDWIALRSFLKLSTIKYINLRNQENQAATSFFDLNYLKNLTSSLPYTLSITQKQAIWDILKDITYD